MKTMRKLWLSLIATALVIFAIVPSAFALDIRQGTRITVAKGETVNDDLLLMGDNFIIEGNVDGDVYAFGNNITVTGTINGNLITAGSHVDLHGTVTGSVLSAGSNVFIDGRVERSLLGAGSSVTLDGTGSVGRSVIAAGDHVNIVGTVGRGMLAGGNQVTVSGQIGQELRVWASNLRIAAPAVVNGPVTYTGQHEAQVENGARTGELTYYHAETNYQQVNWMPRMWTFLKFVGFLAIGLIFLALFPSLRRSFPALFIEKPWQVPLTGFLALVAFPIALVIVMMTIIGIPLGLLSMVLAPALAYFGQVLTSFAAARLLADQLDFMRNWAWPVLFAAGALVTTVLTQLPGFGWFFTAAFLFYGLGGVLWLIVRRPQVTA
jgi:cytoskeletal protein CcmA (bactofilin family)